MVRQRSPIDRRGSTGSNSLERDVNASAILERSILNREPTLIYRQGCGGSRAYPQNAGCEVGIYLGLDGSPSQGTMHTHSHIQGQLPRDIFMFSDVFSAFSEPWVSECSQGFNVSFCIACHYTLRDGCQKGSQGP
ncbi:hypothetical protein PGIGA_G00134820 [Pangasianodon gigas]|uniref:Uncharacterized protein n=1 Tax=Pangasianodon gigas TaxID=30993 RepID=A0ACC5XJS7_PANGG|nr:hypothetical protein [Pangasianodon gigas]